MPNRRIPTVLIDYEEIYKALKRSNISIRKLAKKISVSDRQLRHHLETGCCPPYILAKICDELHITVKSALKERSIWMRLGVRVPITEEEFDELSMQTDKLDCDVDICDSMANEFLKRAVVDGDSYIPFSCLEEGWC